MKAIVLLSSIYTTSALPTAFQSQNGFVSFIHRFPDALLALRKHSSDDGSVSFFVVDGFSPSCFSEEDSELFEIPAILKQIQAHSPKLSSCHLITTSFSNQKRWSSEHSGALPFFSHTPKDPFLNLGHICDEIGKLFFREHPSSGEVSSNGEEFFSNTLGTLGASFLIDLTPLLPYVEEAISNKSSLPFIQSETPEVAKLLQPLLCQEPLKNTSPLFIGSPEKIMKLESDAARQSPFYFLIFEDTQASYLALQSSLQLLRQYLPHRILRKKIKILILRHGRTRISVYSMKDVPLKL